MYAMLWRNLPGPWWVKLFIVLVLLVGIFFLLMEVVFPWVGPMMPWTDVGVSEGLLRIADAQRVLGLWRLELQVLDRLFGDLLRLHGLFLGGSHYHCRFVLPHGVHGTSFTVTAAAPAAPSLWL